MDKAKKEYLESIYEKIMEFQRTGPYDIMCMKTKAMGGKKVMGFKPLVSKTLKGI